MPLTATKTYTVTETPPAGAETRHLITITDDANGVAVLHAYGATRAIAIQSVESFGFTVIDS